VYRNAYLKENAKLVAIVAGLAVAMLTLFMGGLGSRGGVENVRGAQQRVLADQSKMMSPPASLGGIMDNVQTQFQGQGEEQEVVDWDKVPPHLRGYYAKMLGVGEQFRGVAKSAEEQIQELQVQFDQENAAAMQGIHQKGSAIAEVGVEGMANNNAPPESSLKVPAVNLDEFSRQQEELEKNGGVARAEEQQAKQQEEAQRLQQAAEAAEAAKVQAEQQAQKEAQRAQEEGERQRLQAAAAAAAEAAKVQAEQQERERQQRAQEEEAQRQQQAAAVAKALAEQQAQQEEVQRQQQAAAAAVEAAKAQAEQQEQQQAAAAEAAKAQVEQQAQQEQQAAAAAAEAAEAQAEQAAAQQQQQPAEQAPPPAMNLPNDAEMEESRRKAAEEAQRIAAAQNENDNGEGSGDNTGAIDALQNELSDLMSLLQNKGLG